ncbi:hypothetical protein GCM10022377_10590 [Zhihengliuella alba]|uniref:CobQ/CobB/MinD/ParA nucleotide binding domain-containing protein n=1 Tax=Zhihengliuella alba TaxID=547018 RepID=A0ABP7D1C5_9MICC
MSTNTPPQPDGQRRPLSRTLPDPWGPDDGGGAGQPGTPAAGPRPGSPAARRTIEQPVPGSSRRGAGAPRGRGGSRVTAGTGAGGVGEALSYDVLRLSGVRGSDSALARTLGALVGGDPDAQRLPELAALAQAPVATGRRVAVFATRGGAGATTTAALLARFFSAARPDRVAVLDAAEEHGSLGLRLGVAGGRPGPATLAGLLPATTGGNLPTAEELDGLLGHAAQNLAATASPGADAADQAHEVPGSLLREACATISRYFALTIVDCPTGIRRPATGAALADAHAAVWVVPGTLSGVEDALARLAGPTLRGLAASGRLLVVVAQQDRAAPVPTAVHARRFNELGYEAHALGYDAHLAAGARIRAGLLGAERRTALAGLAARVLDVANAAPASAPSAAPRSGRRA